MYILYLLLLESQSFCIVLLWTFKNSFLLYWPLLERSNCSDNTDCLMEPSLSLHAKGGNSSTLLLTYLLTPNIIIYDFYSDQLYTYTEKIIGFWQWLEVNSVSTQMLILIGIHNKWEYFYKITNYVISKLANQ